MSPLLARREALIIVAMVLSLTYFYLVPVPLLAIPGLFLFALFAWRRLDIALALLPLTFPFWYVPKRLFDNKVFPLSEIVLALCVALAAAQLVVAYRHRRLSRLSLTWIRADLDLCVRRLGVLLAAGTVLLVVGVSVGVVVARRHPEALRAWRWEIAEPLIYFVLLLRYAQSRRAIVLLVWSFLGSALLVALLATAQVLWFHVTFTSIEHGNQLVHSVDATGAVPRATAIIYGSSNSLGAWLGRAMPLALALACTSLTQRWIRLVAWLLVLAYLPALFWSDSRGAWVATVAASLVVACLLSPLARKLALGLIPIGVIVVIWQRTALVNALLLGHGGSGEVRTLLWLASWHMIRDHLFLGIGPDQFLYYYSPLYTAHPYWIPRVNGSITAAFYQPDLAQPHNLLLDLWLSGGLFALIGFVALLAGITGHFWHIWRSSPVWQLRQISPSQPGGHIQKSRFPRVLGMPAGPLALGIAGSVLAGVIHGMVDSAYFSPDLALAFWWAVALLLLIQHQIELYLRS